MKVRENQGILIVRIDGIGDYILFRNHLSVIRKNHDKNITIILDKSCEELALFYDAKNVNKFIFIDKTKFSSSLKYKIQIMNQLSSFKFDMVLAPALSRDFKITDFIVANVKSEIKIGFIPDSSNMNFIERKISKLIYTKNIEPNSGVKFEFLRNTEYISAILDDTSLNVNFGIETAKLGTVKDHLNHHPYIFIFSGGSSKYKRWPLENYIELIRLINRDFKGYSFIFLGNPDEKFKINNLISKNSHNNIVNITGEYSLVELGSILSKSTLIISNDSFIPHLSVAHNKNVPVLVLYAGYHYGRFLPYPETLSGRHYVINPNDKQFHQLQYKIESITAKTAFNTITSLDLIPRIAQN